MKRRGFLSVLGLASVFPWRRAEPVALAPKQLQFHPDAIALSMEPLVLPATRLTTHPSGAWTYDVLYGTSVIRPELAIRITDRRSRSDRKADRKAYRKKTAKAEATRRLVTILDHDFVGTCDHSGDCWIGGRCHKRSGEVGDVICGSPEGRHRRPYAIVARPAIRFRTRW